MVDTNLTARNKIFSNIELESSLLLDTMNKILLSCECTQKLFIFFWVILYNDKMNIDIKVICEDWWEKWGGQISLLPLK